MIHCTMEDLLAVKDGEGSAWSRRHVGECADCQEGLDALHQRVARLKALSTLNPPRDRWPAVRENLISARRKNRMTKVRWGSLALAASLAGVIAVKGIQTQRSSAANAQDLASLVSRSQQLEETLREYDPTSRVMSVGKAGAVAELEDRIATVDAELDQSPSMPRGNLVNLWRQRVNLMEGLVNVHVASATYSGM